MPQAPPAIDPGHPPCPPAARRRDPAAPPGFMRRFRRHCRVWRAPSVARACARFLALLECRDLTGLSRLNLREDAPRE